MHVKRLITCAVHTTYHQVSLTLKSLFSSIKFIIDCLQDRITECRPSRITVALPKTEQAARKKKFWWLSCTHT